MRPSRQAAVAECHPLSGIRTDARHHHAPAFPQVEPQFAPTCYVRVPDSPLLIPGAAAQDDIPMHWSLGPGWVVAWKAATYVETVDANLGTLWTPSEIYNQYMLIRCTVNGHDSLFTDAESPAWSRIGYTHHDAQGWVPWLWRVEPGDVWSWSYWNVDLVGAGGRASVKTEIGLQFVSDADMAIQTAGHYPSPVGAIPLARTIPSRWMHPPEPRPRLTPGDQSDARRIDFQRGPGQLVCWSGSNRASASDGEIVRGFASAALDATCEVQASWHDGEHLVQNGSGPDWMSLYLLFGGAGGRRIQPLCRGYTSGDQLTVRLRNVGPNLTDTVVQQPDVSFGYRLDRDLVPNGRG